MRCPKCQSDYPDGMKFCGECGTKLEKICLRCNSSNPTQFKFCGECGQSLTLPPQPAQKELSFDEKIDKIQRYLPKGLTEKILSQRDKIEGERKQVTVMFCDMVEFTALSEKFDPEDIYPIIDKVLEFLIHKVHDYEGMVNKMTGDGIMALFGAPIALEDAPQRAIRLAFAIHREMARFSDQIKEQNKDIPAIKMRVGIHTGPVVVGTIGNNLRVEFTAVGNTVNLASRMEGLADSGTTYVSDETFKLTEGFFRFENQGQKQVKGIEQPVTVYRVIAPSTSRTRFDVSAEKGLKILGVDEAFTLPYFLELLSVKDSGLDKISMSPQEKKDRIMAAYKRITIKGSEIRPLILVFEDLHWSDKSSEEVLKYVLESIVGARILMIFSYRPEFVHTWGGKSYHNQINLNRLSNRESLSMVADLLKTEHIDSDLEELILEKTEGVPFFIEEFIRSLNDLKIIEEKNDKYRLIKDFQDVSIPSTIHDVIMSRVDSFSEGPKDLLQAGSAIEREFIYELIKQVNKLPEQQLLSYLSVLKDSELLFERGIYPETTYIFKHALTRDVVYDSILTSKKKLLHDKIGGAVEKLYADRIEEQYELLAHHYALSENWERAVYFGRLSAEKAYKLSQFQQAITIYEQTVERLLKLSENKNRQEALVDIQLEICWSNIGLGEFEKAGNIGLQAETTAKLLNDRIRLGITYLGISTAYVYRGNFIKTEYYSLKAIQYLEGTSVERELAIANLVLGACYIGQGLWQKSEPRFSIAIKTYEKLDQKTEYVMGWNALPYTILCGQLGYNLGVMGRISEGKELFERGYASELEKVSNLTTKMAYCSWQGLFISLIGEDHIGAAANINQLVKVAEKSGSPFMILVFNVAKANVMLAIENYELVVNSGQKALKAIKGKSIRTGHVINLHYNLVMAELELGNLPSAQQHLDEGRKLVDLAPNWWKPRFDFMNGLLLMKETSPDYAKVEDCFQKSIQGDKKVGAIVPAAQTRYYLSRLFASKGEGKRALKMFAELRDEFQNWGIPVWKQNCEKEMKDLAQMDS